MTGLTEHLRDAAAAGLLPELTDIRAEGADEEAREIAAGPYAPILAEALAAAMEMGLDEWHLAIARFIDALPYQRSLLALAGSVDALLGSKRILETYGPQVSNALLHDLTTLISSKPLLAAGRLEGAVRLAIAGASPPFAVLSHLTELPKSIPEEFAERLPRLVGAASDCWASNDVIAAALHGALEELRHDPAAGIDAVYELGCWGIRSALNAESLPSAMHALTTARADFTTVDAAEEGRHDAQTYAAACDALLAFAAQDKARMADASGRLDESLSQRSAWLSGMHAPAWLQPRLAAELSWRRLVLLLQAAANRLDEIVWLDVWEALSTVLDAYAQSRTARPLPGLLASPGLAAVVEPTIENALLEKQSLLAALRRVCVEVPSADPLPFDRATADQLLGRIEVVAARSRESESVTTELDGDKDDDDEPVDSPRLYLLAPSLVHVLGAAHAEDLANGLTDSKLRLLEGVVQTRELARSRTSHPVLDSLLDDLLQQMAQSPDFVGETRKSFGLLLEQTLLFLLSRADLTTKTWGLGEKIKDYRRVLEDGDPRPVEADLQYDFHQWLQSGPLSGLVAVERSDIAIGRADVIVTFGTVRYLTEIKRELTASDPNDLEEKYLHQAAEYGNTNVPFGQLLVLDLTPHPDGTLRLDESVWLAKHCPAGATRERMVVVGVVAGNRLTPSGLST
ncbi:hypothetical protein ACRDU6_09790 [Mycolicibacterium sp. ELW1]|uniref:hypothetical protein n=1 Tax=Mycobacteriaceae TaxID=1762 RepID=UPI0011F080FB|nr:hypothetical protein [Mycobacterium sp. ELW1]QEN12934.1 hypothetical protein D3H54_06340 [Mycobacterium sp. ELW1]